MSVTQLLEKPLLRLLDILENETEVFVHVSRGKALLMKDPDPVGASWLYLYTDRKDALEDAKEQGGRPPSVCEISLVQKRPLLEHLECIVRHGGATGVHLCDGDYGGRIFCLVEDVENKQSEFIKMLLEGDYIKAKEELFYMRADETGIQYVGPPREES